MPIPPELTGAELEARENLRRIVGEAALASATASSQDMDRLQEWFPHKPCAHSLNSPLTKAGLKLRLRLDPSQRYDGASDLSYAEPSCDSLGESGETG
jgi:hypothetical protein